MTKKNDAISHKLCNYQSLLLKMSISQTSEMRREISLLAAQQ